MTSYAIGKHWSHDDTTLHPGPVRRCPECWSRVCPIQRNGCTPATVIQGGPKGLADHLATVHPGEVPPAV